MHQPEDIPLHVVEIYRQPFDPNYFIVSTHFSYQFCATPLDLYTAEGCSSTVPGIKLPQLATQVLLVNHLILR